MKQPNLELLPRHSLLIGDERRTTGAGGALEQTYAATGKPIGEVGLASEAEVDEAVEAARTAFISWRRADGKTRRQLLLRAAAIVREHADALTDLHIIDVGIPRRFANAVPENCAEAFEYYAGWADKIGGEVVPIWDSTSFDYTLDEPYGVVAVIIPWNAPATTVARTIAPALAAGNTVVLKPSELAPYSVIWLADLLLEVGFPPGVINVVPGGPEAGNRLVSHPQVDKVHFTGSCGTAKLIARTCADNLTPASFELGGKSANLVFADADLDKAVESALQGASSNNGQACIAGTRVLVEASIYQDFVERCGRAATAIAVGDPDALATDMGPVAYESSCTRIMRIIDQAKAAGHRLVAGGERLGGELADGYFIAPTVFADVENASELAQEEVFGPVLSMMPFADFDEAIDLANATPFGLAAYVQTRDTVKAHAAARQLDSGMVWVNGNRGIPSAAPFGGVKQSGYGRIGGIAGIREFTRPKNVWLSGE